LSLLQGILAGLAYLKSKRHTLNVLFLLWFAILGDLTYVGSFRQQYAYNGELINANSDPESGSFVNVGIGIVYYFGEEKYHADWY